MSSNLVQYKKGEDKNADQLVELVNKEVANLNVLYTKLHNYHWRVTGPHFFSLHVKLEELYEEVTLNMDELAERLLAIGVTPVATMKEYLDLASVKEATGKENTEDMVKNIADDFEKLSGEFTEIISIAEESEDNVTADMLTGMKKSLDKHTWMLRAYLGK